MLDYSDPNVIKLALVEIIQDEAQEAALDEAERIAERVLLLMSEYAAWCREDAK